MATVALCTMALAACGSGDHSKKPAAPAGGATSGAAGPTGPGAVARRKSAACVTKAGKNAAKAAACLGARAQPTAPSKVTTPAPPDDAKVALCFASAARSQAKAAACLAGAVKAAKGSTSGRGTKLERCINDAGSDPGKVAACAHLPSSKGSSTSSGSSAEARQKTCLKQAGADLKKAQRCISGG